MTSKQFFFLFCMVFAIKAADLKKEKKNLNRFLKYESSEFEGSGGKSIDSIDSILRKISSNVHDIYGDIDNTEGSGTDDDDTELLSGSGSGDDNLDEFSGSITDGTKPTSPKIKSKPTEATQTTFKNVIDITVVSTKSPSTKSKKTTTTESNSVEVNKAVVSDEVGDGDNDDDNDDDDDNGFGFSTKQPNVKSNMPQRAANPDEPKKEINFTMGIIIGVVVGAVLAILVIIFLVYRLRKKDEGSYSLDEQSTQAMLSNDSPTKGDKEVFV